MNRRAWISCLAAIVLGTTALAACGDGDVGSADSADDSPGTTLPAKECPGAPLTFTAITILSGPLAAGGTRARVGTEAAVAAINRECTLGRPLEVKVCDDKGDANANLACGREAAEDGSLALLGIGSFDDGVTASGLPALFGNGTSPFELTNELAFSSTNGLALGMSATTAVKAKGAKSSAAVFPDTPTLQFAGQLLAKVADYLELEVEQIYFPQDTTDFAPIAAQISAADTDAVGMLPLSPVVMINALASEGITPQDKIMVVPGAVLTPEVIEELGDTLNGMLIVSQTAPDTDLDNPGIVEFRADLEAYGEDPDDPEIDFATVTAWSNIKKLEGALLAAGPDVIANLDTDSLVDAVVDNPVDRPEAAPYDFREHAMPEIPDLAPFRIFTRKVMVLEIQDGEYKPLTDGFIDILDPPDIE